MRIGDKAIAKPGYHTFETGEKITFIGYDFEREEVTYMFRCEKGVIQELSKEEFEKVLDN